MPLSKIQSGVIADNAVDADALDLTANYTFTGNITGAGGYTQGTKVSPTSGTTVDFTGIPSDVKVIHILFDKLERTTNNWGIVQLGDSGGFETSGYISSVGYPGSGNSYYANSAADNNGLKMFYYGGTKHSGIVTIMRFSPNQTQWIMSGRCHAAEGGSYSCYSAVEKTLSADLTQIRITMASGTFSGTGGHINILYTT